MKRVLIFSDTHGDINQCLDIISSYGKVDALIHAGDCTRDAEDLTYAYPDLMIYFVKGNNDFFSSAPSFMTAVIDGVRVYITHGHEQRVKYESSYSTLRAEAAKFNPSVVVFGHTHIPYIDYRDNMTVVNPGSTRFSSTYAVMEIENGSAKVQILKI